MSTTPAVAIKVVSNSGNGASSSDVTLAMGVKPGAPPNTNLNQKNPYDIYGGGEESKSAVDIAIENEQYWTEQAILVK